MASPHPWSDPLEGLPLVEPTADGWSAVALEDIDALLADHAHCEQKAASVGLSMIGRFADHDALLRPCMALAQEEIHHFRQVVDLIEERGKKLTRPRPDRYVAELRHRSFQLIGGLGPLGDLLLVSGLVEARSCERFRLLSEGLIAGEGELDDAERQKLALFYRRLAEAEGRHWEMFRDLAQDELGKEPVAGRLDQLAQLESEILRDLPFESRMH